MWKTLSNVGKTFCGISSLHKHTVKQPQQPRPRAPTNEKLEKYKFMLINIEPDADILDPGTFAFEMQEHEDGLSSYLGFEFNDYPAEVLCPPFASTNVATALQQQEG